MESDRGAIERNPGVLTSGVGAMELSCETLEGRVKDLERGIYRIGGNPIEKESLSDKDPRPVDSSILSRLGRVHARMANLESRMVSLSKYLDEKI